MALITITSNVVFCSFETIIKRTGVLLQQLDYTSQQTDCLLLKVLFNPNFKSHVCFDGETRIDRSDLKLTDFPMIMELFVVQLSDL